MSPAAVVLAAGRSLRMGGPHKLLLAVEGQAMIARVVDTILATCADPVVVVTGYRADALRDALGGRSVAFVHNPDFASGLATSIRTGVAALPESCEGALLCHGDMPWLRAGDVQCVIDAFDPGTGPDICLPRYGEQRGHPVLFAARYFPELRELAGDCGARSLLETHAARVHEVAVEHAGVVRDIDTPEDLREARAARRTPA